MATENFTNFVTHRNWVDTWDVDTAVLRVFAFCVYCTWTYFNTNYVAWEPRFAWALYFLHKSPPVKMLK